MKSKKGDAMKFDNLEAQYKAEAELARLKKFTRGYVAGIYNRNLPIYRVSVDKRRQIFVRMADLEVALKKQWRCKMIAYGTKPMELKQDLKAIENEPIKSELECLKESFKLLWNTKAEVERIYALQCYIANKILTPIFADSKVWVADMDYNAIFGLNRFDSIIMPFIIGKSKSQGEWELKNNYINQQRDFRHIFHISDDDYSFATLEIRLYLNSDFEFLPNFHQQYSEAMFMLNDWFNKKDNLVEVQNDKNIEKL